MESAILVDWDPVSELERRIDQGKEYEHWPEKKYYHGSSSSSSSFAKGSNSSSSKRKGIGDMDEEGTVRGVLFGLRTSSYERARLKSANPESASPDYSI